MRRPLHIEYRRPPNHTVTYVQHLIVDDHDVKISLQVSTPIEAPLRVGPATILEPGAPVVWFTFPNLWHDIGRFHRASGEFTGLYANILTPVELHSPSSSIDTPAHWQTTDLFLDVWMGEGQPPVLLDEAEWDRARSLGHLTESVAARARSEAETLMVAARRGHWPPRVVREWTLEKALAY